VIVWDVASGAERHRFRGHRNWDVGCAISADGGTGLSASLEGPMIVWDVASGTERHRFRGCLPGFIESCAISADGGTGPR
jgi:WD40 repeat protein